MSRVSLIFLLIITYSFLNAQNDSIQFSGSTRYFLQYTPSSYDPQNEYALVIAMHGGFGSGSQLESQSQLSIKAENENFIVVYPDGVRSPLGIRTWNAGICCGYAANNNIDDVGFINNLIDTLLTRYSIDTTRIYATGMSNGGYMSYRLACESSGRFAAIAPVAASMNTECFPEFSVPVIHFQSYLDSNVLYQGGRGQGASDHYSPPVDSVLNAWSVHNNCQNYDTVYNGIDFDHLVWSSCDCNGKVELYVTYDGGHSWPGGKKTAVGDPVSNYISANDLMWDFFQQHSLCTTTTDTSTTIPDDILINEITVFPNPAKNRLYIVSDHDLTFQIFDKMGRLIINRSLNHSHSKTVNISSLGPGIYILRICTPVNTLMKRIVVAN